MSLESSEELEVMEGSMIDYANKDYYRSKIKDQDICKEYIAAHSRYSILEILAMFQHDFSTQKKRSNKSFSCINGTKNKKIETTLINN